MPTIPQKLRDQIIDSANLYEYIMQTHGTDLKRSGANYVGCCPFHNEKTPSFYVYPDGHFHCYGCGKHGNIITWVMEIENMTFPEACRHLARHYNIPFKEHEESEKERTERLEREALHITNEAVYRNFREAFLECQEAQDYAYNRWGKEYCDEIGMGYAPGGQFLMGKHHFPKHLQALGLINEQDEDFFRNRLVTPIRDRFHRTIAFTARRMDGEKKFKYINSKESPIFKKGNSLFGIDKAFTCPDSRKIVYWVEGTPDASRLQIIGCNNVVACLGSEWTEKQFDLVKRMTRNICIIPDCDIPKAGDLYGPGTIAAFKTGRKAIEAGFTVSVKPIPNDTGMKQDPDSYFKNRQIFDQTTEEDFILWYAKCHFDNAYSPTEKTEVVKKVASLLACLTDKTKQSVYLDELKNYVPGKRLWQQAIEGEKAKTELERTKMEQSDTESMDKKYGFHVENHKYYSVTDKGTVNVWGNFELQALPLILDPENPVRLFKMTNEHGRQVLISFEANDLVSLSAFKTKVEQKGNFIWKAGEKELTKLKEYLYLKAKEAYPIKQLGWQKNDFFAFGNGVCIDGDFYETDNYGIVTLENRGTYYLPSNAEFNRNDNRQFAFEHQFVYRALSSVKLRDYCDQLFLVYGNNGRVGFAFFLAALFKDIVIRKTRSFPLLNLFGPKGSGKSDMAQVLMAFFIIENKGISLTNSTMPSLGSAVGAVANALVHLEEYKNQLDPKRIEFLKGLWDGIGRTRMSLDNGKKETSAVDCGVIVSGQEMPTEDIALFTRIIFLQFPRSEFTLDEKREHKKLMAMASTGLTHLTIMILAMREHMEKYFHSVYDETFDIVSSKLENEPIEDRILKNWVTPLAVFRTLEMKLGIRMSPQELMDICVKGIKNQSRETKSNSELGGFWNVIQYLASDGDINEDCDYKIQYKRKFKSSTVDKEWQDNKGILFIQKSRVFMLYKMRSRSAGDNIIPEESLRYYLEQSRAFLGEKSIRYTVCVKGVPQIEPGSVPDSRGRYRYQQSLQRSYCFDYDMLRRIHDIHLPTKTESNAGEEADEESA